MDSYPEKKGKGLEHKCGQIWQPTLDNGTRMKHMVRECLPILQATTMRDNGFNRGLMDMENL